MPYSELIQTKQVLSFLERFFTVLVLFLSSGVFLSLLMEENWVGIDPARGNTILRQLWLIIYTIILLLLLMRLPEIIRTALQEKYLWLLLGLTVFSITWSCDPEITLRRTISLLGATAFGIYLASRYTRQELLQLLACAFGLSAVLSLGSALFMPSYGIHHVWSGTPWRGIYINRNTLGGLMVLSTMIWFLYSLSAAARVFIPGLVFCCISALLIFMSKSVTALLVFFMLLPLSLICLAARLRFTRAVCLSALIIMAVCFSSFLLVNNVETVPTYLERDMTLTGRTMIWETAWGMIRLRPWLGYGFGVFWSECNKLPFGVQSFYAHNGFLDLWLNLGLLGLVFFIISLSVNLCKSLAVVFGKKDLDNIFPLIFFVFMLLYNVPESVLMVQNSIFWILYVAFTIQLSFKYKNTLSEPRYSQVFENSCFTSRVVQDKE